MSYQSIQAQALSSDIVNTNVQTLDNIKRIKSQKEQLKKVSLKNLRLSLVSKMISALDKTVDKDGGIFGSDDQSTWNKFKSFIFDEVGRQIANNPNSTVGFAKQIYTQMEKALPKEETEIQETAKQAAAAQGLKHYRELNKEI